jgi:SAM-dependent methyltransferase
MPYLGDDIRPCPACLGSRSRELGVANGFPVRSCAACRTIFTARLPEEDDAEDYGSYYHEGNLEVPDFVRRRLEEIVSGFDRHRRLNSWLDVGCGAGTLLHAVAARGWDGIGTEIASVAVDKLRSEGLDVRRGELGELDLPPGGFDVVSMIEVLEHVPFPDALLESCRTLVRPGGALYITTPHARGLSGRLLGARWQVVGPPEHLQLYSTRGLRTAVTRAGFSRGSVETHGVNPKALRDALLPSRDGAEPGESPVSSAYRLNEALSSSRRGVLAKRAANGILDATRLGDNLKLVADRAPG